MIDIALALAVEVLTAVEGHVLQEVCKTALALLLLDGAHALRDVEVHTMLRIVVVADVVGQATIQFADAHSRVHRDGRHLLSRHYVKAARHQEQQRSKQFFSPHHKIHCFNSIVVHYMFLPIRRKGTPKNYTVT